jgi:putative PEP-CTERM system TPR-repeat lipoprotein
MQNRRSAHRFVLAIAVAATLSACGSGDAEKHLSTAKELLTRNDNRAAIIEIKNALQKNPDLVAARLLLGRTLLDEGDARAAQVELGKARELGAPVDEYLPLLLRSYLATGEFKRIIDEAGKSAPSSPESAAAVETALGGALLATGKRDDAAQAFTRALAKLPDYAPALLAQARLAAAGRNFDQAKALVDRILAANVKDHEALQLRGDILAAAGERDAALEAYRKAVEARPSFTAARHSIVNTLLAQGKTDDAGREAEAMAKTAKNHPLTLSAAMRVAMARKDFKQAREHAQQLLRLAPSNPLVLVQAGIIEFQLKSLSQADSHLSQAVKLAPESTIARRWLALVNLATGQPARALETLKPVIEKNIEDPTLLSLAGEAYLRNGDPKRAEEMYAAAAKLDPADARKRTGLAITRFAKGDADTGFAELERISASDTGTSADMALIAGHLRRNEFDAALKAANALEKKMPDSPVPYEIRGRIHLAKRDNASARKQFERAVAISPAHFPAVLGLAGLDVNDKKPEEAAKRFEALLATDPKNTQAWLALAGLKRQTGGSTDDVAALLAKGIAAQPDDPAARLALAELYLRAGDQRRALSSVQDGIAAIPNRPELYEALGRVQMAAKEYNQALTAFAKQAALLPGSPTPHLLMAEVNMAAQKPEAAAQNLRQALQVRPDLVEAQRGLIGIDIQTNKGQNALGIAREVQKQRPKEAIGFVLEGDIHTSRKAWKEAIAAFRTALKQEPSSGTAIKLNGALEAGDEKAEATRFAEGWNREHPKDTAFQMHLAELALARGDLPGASQRFRALLTVLPDNPILLNNLAWVAGRLKAPDAITLAEKANKLSPNQPAFMDTLAMLLSDKGEQARALELLGKAVELAPQAYGIKLNQARVLIAAGKKPEARRILEDLAALGDKFPARQEIDKLAAQL